MKETLNSQEQTKAIVPPNQRRRRQTAWMAKTGILSAAAIALMYLEISLPLFPGFLKFDFSEIPALLATFAMGPLAGIAVELIKNIAHLPATHTLMVGELANFIMGSFFVGTAGLIYKHKKTRGGAILSMAAGTLALTASGALINYFFTIPFYISVMGFSMEGIVAATHAAGNTLVTGLPSLILWVFIPFNLMKGIVVSVIVGLIYKKLSPLLHR
ncbi:MAG TPA: ECF transporter S component [Bacillota bacterium]|jgi:riboflavin transporter FmnP|nr:ECF transporter S component [Fastidiosipila sp.]HPX93690.1 ECF transporter S component [Bacillota bacterium]HQB81406.1 ECF transporter S component [Bacillota bacterium]